MELKHSELLVNLSAEEQEAVSGGFSNYPGSFLQITNIKSSASSEFHLSQSGFSSSSQSEYLFSQITIGMNSSYGGGKSRKHGHNQSSSGSGNLMAMLMSLMYS